MVGNSQVVGERDFRTAKCYRGIRPTVGLNAAAVAYVALRCRVLENVHYSQLEASISDTHDYDLFGICRLSFR